MSSISLFRSKKHLHSLVYACWMQDRRNNKTRKVTLHSAPTKEPEFDLERAKETFMEAKKSFTDASTSGSKDKLEPKMDPINAHYIFGDMHEATV